MNGSCSISQTALIEVNQPISAHQAFAAGVCADLDGGATSGRADFKARSVFGEGIRPLFVVERCRDQEFLVAGFRIGIVYVAYLPEVELIPYRRYRLNTVRSRNVWYSRRGLGSP